MLFAQEAAPSHLIFVLIGALVLVCQVLLMAFLFSRFYRRCPPNQVLIRSGQGGQRRVSGTGMFVIPVLHKSAYLTLDLMASEIASKRTTLADGKTADISVSASVAIGTEEKVLNNAATRLLGLSTSEIKEQAEQVIAGPLRDLLGEMDEAALLKNHASFQERMFEVVERKLNDIGLVLINANVREVTVTS